MIHSQRTGGRRGASDFAAGCPVVAATVEGEHLPSAHKAAAASFASWEDLLVGAIQQRGQSPERARSLATLVIAAIEGAVILARAQRSAAPFERVAAELEGLLAAATTGS